MRFKPTKAMLEFVQDAYRAVAPHSGSITRAKIDIHDMMIEAFPSTPTHLLAHTIERHPLFSTTTTKAEKSL